MALNFLNNGYFAGKVGIGIESPTSPLHIESADDALLRLKSTDNKAYIALSDNDTNGYISSENSKLSLGANTGVNANNLNIDLSNNNVGIGTASPNQLLELKKTSGTVTARLHADHDSSPATGIEFMRGLSDTWGGDAYTDWKIGSGSSSDADFAITSKDTTRGENERVTIEYDTGNVGIGTTSPGFALDVHGDSTAGVLSVKNAANGRDTFRSENAAGTRTVNIGNDGSGHGNILIRNSAGTTTNYISGSGNSYFNGGNVGIGTTSPQDRLHVKNSDAVGGNSRCDIRLENGLGYAEFGVLSNYARIQANGTEVAALSGSLSLFYGSNWTFGSNLTTVTTDGKLTINSGNGTGGEAYLSLSRNNVSGFILNHTATAIQVRATANIPMFFYTNDTIGIKLNANSTISFPEYGAGTLVTDSSGNITVSSGGGAGGPYLPLAGGTMTGSIDFGTNNRDISMTDAAGAVTRVMVLNTSNTMYIGPVDTYAGGSILYGTAAGVSYQRFFTGAVERLRIDGSGNVMIGNTGAGAKLDVRADTGYVFRTENASGNTFRIEASSGNIYTTGDLYIEDSNKIRLGASYDLQIYHDGSHSRIDDTGTGKLILRGNSAIELHKYTGEYMITAVADGAVSLYNDDVKKLSTGSEGVGAATTTGGTLIDGWITTTQANAINNTTIATTAYVNNKIALIPAGLVFQGTWNAATNTPTLTSGSGTTGNFYIVSVAGSTNLDGITDWKVGDWAVFIEQGASDQWEKIDNSSVLDGIGTGEALPLWSGSGTSNTLTNSHITQSTSLANDIIIPQYIRHTGDTNTFFGFSQPDNFIINTNNASALTINSAQNATFAGDVTIQSTGVKPLLFTKSTYGDFSTDAFYRIKFQDQGGVTNDVGLGQTATGSLGFNITAGKSFIFNNGTSGQLLSLSGTYAAFSSSKVGIGTTTPAKQLVVRGSAPWIRIEEDSASNKRLDLWVDPTSAIGYIGANQSAQQLSFQTGNSDRIRILNNGNVGIGTTSPRGKLDIVGNTDNDTDFLTIQDNDTSAGSHRPSIRFRSDTAQIGQIVGLDNSMRFSVGTTETSLLEIASSGNIGIGTTGPTALLEVKKDNATIYDATSDSGQDNNTATVLVSNDNVTTNTFSQIAFHNKGNNRGISRIVSIGVGSASTDLAFVTENNNTKAEKMRIKDDGKVGIGTTSPGTYAKLEVSTSQQYGGIVLSNGTNNVGWISGNSASNDNGQLSLSSGGVQKVQINAASNSYFNGGNVGIGTTSPAKKLDVAGEIQGTNFFAETYRSARTDGDVYIQAATAADFVAIGTQVSSNLMRIEGGGNVGIGVTGPVAKLSIVGSGENGGILFNNSGAQEHRFYSSANSQFNTIGSSAPIWHWAQYTGVGVTPNYKMTLNNTGLGIGTTSPVATLDITKITPSVTTFYPYLQLSQRGTVANSKTGISFRNTEYNWDMGHIATERQGSSNSFDLVFYTANAGADGEGLRIDHLGNVGIGTTGPQSKLQVAGGIQMADDTATASADKVGTMRYRTATNEPVPVTGTDLVTNGDFATNTNWSLNTGVTISGGTMNFTSVAGQYGSQNINFTNGAKYLIRFEITAETSGSLTVFLGAGNNVGNFSGVGQKQIVATGSSSLDTKIYFGNNFTGSIDNVSVVEVTEEDASYADMCMQTGSSTYEWVNIVRNTY